MMRLLHTKLPEFFKMMKRAANWGSRPKDIEITGLEHLHSAKMQSMRSGRIQHAVGEIAKMDNVDRLELKVIARVPETMHTVIIKGYDADGECCKAILDIVNILQPTEDAYLLDCNLDRIEDRRPKVGGQ